MRHGKLNCLLLVDIVVNLGFDKSHRWDTRSSHNLQLISGDGSEIQRSPVEVGNYAISFTGFYTSKTVVGLWDFWTSNSINQMIQAMTFFELVRKSDPNSNFEMWPPTFGYYKTGTNWITCKFFILVDYARYPMNITHKKPHSKKPGIPSVQAKQIPASNDRHLSGTGLANVYEKPTPSTLVGGNIHWAHIVVIVDTKGL